MNPIETRLRRLTGETKVRFVSQVDPSWKTVVNNPFLDRVKKRSLIVGRVLPDYGAEVNAVRYEKGEEPTFKPGLRKWGVREQGTCIVTNKDDRYVEVVVDQVVWSHFVHIATDTIVPKDLIESYLRPSTLQDVRIRDYNIANIHWLEVLP